MVARGVRETMRVERPAHRPDVAAIGIAHQSVDDRLPVHRDRHAAFVEPEPCQLPPASLDGFQFEAMLGHHRLELLGQHILAEIEMLRHADREGRSQFGMSGAAMIAFAGILHDQLPVGMFDQHALISDLGIGHVMRRGKGRHPSPELVKGGRLVGQADEHHARDNLQRDRLEPMIGLLEIVGHPPCRKQRPVEVVGPAMIGADQLGDRSRSRRAQHRSTVATTVVEGADLPRLVADDDHRPLADHQRDIARRLGQFDFEPGHQPAGGIDGRQVEREHRRIIIQRLGQAVAGPTRLETAANLAKIHQGAPPGEQACLIGR